MKYTYQPRKTCRREYRNALLALLSGVREDPRYLLMVQYMLESGNIDEHTGRLLVGCDILARIEGREKQYQSHHYNGEQFLVEIKQCVLPGLTWSPHCFNLKDEYGNPLPNKVRAIKTTGLPEELLKLAARERRPFGKDERVEFLTGRPYTRKTKARYRKEDQDNALALLAGMNCREAKNAMEYLNNLPVNRFTGLLKNIDRAYYILCHMKKATQEATDAFLCQQMKILNCVEDQPQVFYKPGIREAGTRSFSSNTSILMLPREVRKALTQGADWLEFDLKSAQLAICATDWNIPMVQDFLRNNQLGIWKDLARHFDIELTPAIKGEFKDALYAILFGADKAWVKGQLTKELDIPKGKGIRKAGDLFCDHQVIKAMLEAREERLVQIRKDGGATNCFGMWVPMLKDEDGEDNPRSVLALLAQAREIQLLYPAFELAMNTDEYDITLYQHDGFCLAVKDRRPHCIAKSIREVTEAVNRKAEELGIETYLDQDI